MSIEKKNVDTENWLPLYGNYLFSVALLKVNDRQMAEDLVQETFVLAFKARNSFEHNSSEKTWLTTILKNKIIDHYRKKDVLKNVSVYLSDTEPGFSEAFFNAPDGHWLEKAIPGHWNDHADSTVNRNEFYTILQQCIKKMPPKLVPVFIAKFLDEEDSETICKENGLSSSNYWVIIHRAKVLMRSCLEKNWFLG